MRSSNHRSFSRLEPVASRLASRAALLITASGLSFTTKNTMIPSSTAVVE